MSFACNYFGVLCFVTRLTPHDTFYDKSAFIFDLNTVDDNMPSTTAHAITIIIGTINVLLEKSSFTLERADLVQ